MSNINTQDNRDTLERVFGIVRHELHLLGRDNIRIINVDQRELLSLFPPGEALGMIMTKRDNLSLVVGEEGVGFKDIFTFRVTCPQIMYLVLFHELGHIACSPEKNRKGMSKAEVVEDESRASLWALNRHLEMGLPYELYFEAVKEYCKALSSYTQGLLGNNKAVLSFIETAYGLAKNHYGSNIDPIVSIGEAYHG